MKALFEKWIDTGKPQSRVKIRPFEQLEKVDKKPAITPSTESNLEELGSMKEKWLISQEEYDTIRKNFRSLKMKRLFLVPLIFGITSPVHAGIYYYTSFQDGIEVRCKDGKPKHLMEISKSGRGMKLEGHGEDQYSWPITYLFPEAPDEKYKYFPSPAGIQCSYRILDEKEKNSLILKAFKTCFSSEGDTETKLKIRNKYCFGWD